MIPIYKPYLTKYKASAIQAIETGWVSNLGVYVSDAESLLRDIMGVKYCILMNNGTSPTHCLFLALKFAHPTIKKIYVPNNVFIAPWNCALMEYDDFEVMKMDPTTMNIDVSDEIIMSLEPNSCILLVHNLGNIINTPKLKRMRPDIIFVEDNCEGFWGKHEGIYSGTSEASLCSSVSFYANKIICSGEGGAFLTNNQEVYKYIKRIYSHGATSERYIHDGLATNYRMTNVAAALLYDQLKDIEHILTLKRSVFSTYDMLLADEYDNGSLIKLVRDADTVPADWMYCLIVKDRKYGDIEKFMTSKGIETRPFFYDIRRHNHLKDMKVDYEPLDVASNGVMIPSYPELLPSEQQYIAECLKEFLKN